MRRTDEVVCGMSDDSGCTEDRAKRNERVNLNNRTVSHLNGNGRRKRNREKTEGFDCMRRNDRDIGTSIEN